MEKLYSPKDLTQILKLGQRAIYRMIKNKEIPAIHLNARAIRIRESAVEGYLNSKEKE